jgi:hypothetical protein
LPPPSPMRPVGLTAQLSQPSSPLCPRSPIGGAQPSSLPARRTAPDLSPTRPRHPAPEPLLDLVRMPRSAPQAM